jgi:hypothetical protein
MIHDHLANNNRHEPVPGRRVALILKENQKNVIDRWLSLVKEDPDLRELPLTDRERADHLPGVLSGMVDMLTSHPGETSLQAMQDAAKHGRERRRQGYTLPMLCSEARILRHAIFTVVQEHLLAVDISYLLADIIQIGDTLDAQLRVAVESYLANGAEPKAA